MSGFFYTITTLFLRSKESVSPSSNSEAFGGATIVTLKIVIEFKLIFLLPKSVNENIYTDVTKDETHVDTSQRKSWSIMSQIINLKSLMLNLNYCLIYFQCYFYTLSLTVSFIEWRTKQQQQSSWWCYRHKYHAFLLFENITHCV